MKIRHTKPMPGQGKSLSEPLYKRVYNLVVERIAQSQYLPGSMLPSEMDLAAELKVSQGTARKAMIELEQNGIVQRRQGKGTFVTVRTPENSLFHFFPLRDEASEQVSPQLTTENVIQRKATASERKTLFGQPGSVFEINRIRHFREKPLSIEKSVVSTTLFPGLKDRQPLPNALYVVFQHSYSCIVLSADEKLTAEKLGQELSEKVNLPADTPVIKARRKAYDLQERVVEMRTSIYITDPVSYSVRLD